MSKKVRRALSSWAPEAAVTLDLRMVTVHEAGHIVAALNSGVRVASGRLFKRNDGTELGIRSVGGWSRFHQPLAKLTDAVVGFAGVSAEMLVYDTDLQAREIAHYLEDDVCTPSETDWQCIQRIHKSWHQRALIRAVETLKANWTEVEKCAAGLVRHYEAQADFAPDADHYGDCCYFTKETLSMSKEHQQ